MGVTDPQLLRMVPELAQYKSRKKHWQMNLKNDTKPLALIQEDIEQTKTALVENVEKWP